MPHDTPPICPRCGYDLSGTAAAFTEQCPMQGTCSECGHEFRWTEVLSPHLTTLPGFIEHTRTLRDFIHAAVTTLFWLIRPRVFWSRLTLDHRINFSRPIIAAFALHTAFQLLQACASYAIFIITLQLTVGTKVPGYASLLVVMLFLGGIQLITLGVIGEYLARIYNEVKGRPLYLVEKSYGLDRCDRSVGCDRSVDRCDQSVDRSVNHVHRVD